MVIIYSLIALVMRGFIVVDEGVHFMIQGNRVRQDLTAADDEDERQSKAVANLMLMLVHSIDFRAQSDDPQLSRGVRYMRLSYDHR